MKFWICLLGCIALALAGCPGEDGGDDDDSKPQPVKPGQVIGPAPGGSSDPGGGAPVALTISGTVTFDRLPVTAAGLGATPSVENAANVLVEAVQHNAINTVLASTTTDAAGAYTLNFNTTVDYFVRARAESGNAPDTDRVYHSQTSPPIVHAVPGMILNRAAGSQTVNLHASFDLPQIRGGAFAILDTVRRLRAAALPAYSSLGPLDLFWGPQNQGTQFLKTAGGDTITLNTFTGLDGPNGNPSIYLLGGEKGNLADSDHDQYDETVIAHEWASFLQLTQSRDNNFGGPHGGEQLIFTASYSEGVVTAIGCGLLGVNVYRDTLGYAGSSSVQFEFGLESGVVPGAGVGYGNEFRMSRVTWDLIDGGAGWPADADTDPAAVDLVDFFASFSALATRAAPYEVAWMASLLQQLIDDAQLTQGNADVIVQVHGESFPPSGGFDPYPPALVIGGAPQSATLNANEGNDTNPILGPGANAVYRLEVAAAQNVTLQLDNTTPGYDNGKHRLVLTVHDLQRNILAQDATLTADKTLVVSLAAGTYIVRVQHRPAQPWHLDDTSCALQAN
jgi:hypothetical protein